MNGLEAAIKNALARSDRSSAEVRAKIYQSSRDALEAGLRKQNIEDPQVIAGHRQRLEQLIRIIEADERERLLSLVAEHVKKTGSTQESAAPAAAASSGARLEPSFDDEPSEPAYVEPPAIEQVAVPPSQRETTSATPVRSRVLAPEPTQRDTRVEPTVAAAPRARTEPKLGEDEQFAVSPDDHPRAYDLTNAGRSDDELSFKPEPIVVHKKRRGFFARLLIYFTLLAFVALGAAWIYTSGVLITAEQRDQSVPNPPVQIEEEDFDGQDDAVSQAPPNEPTQQLSGGFSDDWLEVFNADANVGALTPGSLVSLQSVQLPSGKAIRVSSRSSSAGGDLSLTVPVELMRQLSGRSATIAITLQSSTDTPTQVAVDCDFKNLGSCSRHRFTAMPERSDLLIDARFTDAIVANTAGKITLNADIAGEGREINLFSVRILPSR